MSMDREEAVAHVALWINEERAHYANQKWEVDNADRQTEIVKNGEWLNHPFSYLQRARAGLDTLQGRMALGKVITSCTSLLERAVMQFGEMPQPGVSSTDGPREWERDAEPDEGGKVEVESQHQQALRLLSEIKSFMGDMTISADASGRESVVGDMFDSVIGAMQATITNHAKVEEGIRARASKLCPRCGCVKDDELSDCEHGFHARIPLPPPLPASRPQGDRPNTGKGWMGDSD